MRAPASASWIAGAVNSDSGISSSAATEDPFVSQSPSVVQRGSWYYHHRTPDHSASSQIRRAHACVTARSRVTT